MKTVLNLAVVGCLCLMASCASTETSNVSPGAVAQVECTDSDTSCCKSQSGVAQVESTSGCCSSNSGVAQVESTSSGCCKSTSRADAVKQVETTGSGCCSSSAKTETDGVMQVETTEGDAAACPSSGQGCSSSDKAEKTGACPYSGG